MKNNKVKTVTRLLLIACGLALIAVLIVPMWRIELNAPQYPEGLIMLIYANKLGGNVDIINGLNHYIGMKTLHTGDFIEFTLLPWIIIFFIAAFIFTAISGRKKLLNILLVLFVSFGAIAMIDFWRWEYNYGHNLNPEAAIIVPGMAYQPPLIGFKQLLNFGAYSVPDAGGWIFVGAGAVLLILVIYEWQLTRKQKSVLPTARSLALLLFLGSLNSCQAGPEPVILGTDHCAFCKMTISDNRFGAELITRKGRVYKFDDAQCLLNYIGSGELKKQDIADIYLTNFTISHELVRAEKAYLLKGELFKGPMNGNIAAFGSEDSMKLAENQFSGKSVDWKQLYP